MATTKRSRQQYDWHDIYPPSYLQEAGIKFMFDPINDDKVMYVYRQWADPPTRYQRVGAVRMKYRNLPFKPEKFAKLFLTNKDMGKTIEAKGAIVDAATRQTKDSGS